MNNVAANILYNAIMPGKLNIYFNILFWGGAKFHSFEVISFLKVFLHYLNLSINFISPMYKLKSFKNLLKHLALLFVKPAIINMYVNWTKNLNNSLPLECKVNNNANNMSSKYEDNLLLVCCMGNTNVIWIYQKCTHIDLS